MRKIYLIAIMLLILLPVFVSAATINAASCSYNDVSAAVNAAQSGDTVLVPAGTCTWNSNLIITKGIYLIGAGIDKTTFKSNYTYDALYGPVGYLVSYAPSNPAANEACRLSGFTVDGDLKCRGIFLYNSVTLSPVNKIRVDHTKIVNPLGDRPFGFEGAIYGVADSNVWYGVYISPIGVNAVVMWQNFIFDFGTADNFYFEDNLFISSGVHLVISSAGGVRWCARYNTWDGSALTGGLYPHLDAHGNQPTSSPAVMGVEIYENTITIPSNYNMIFFGQRGGKALVYNNKVYAHAAWTHVREEYNDADNPPVTNPAGQPQHVSDSYWWNNLNNDMTLIHVEINQQYDYGGDEGLVPQENREFWQQKVPFDGTVGMGVGLLAARPATCTVGVGYWATDESKLYRCTATNTWTLYYTPYTYPHPLRTDCTNYPKLCDSGSSPPIACIENDWTHTDGACQPNNTLTRAWTKINANCQGGISHPEAETINCTYIPPNIPGDLNNDGIVDVADLTIVASDLGKTGNFNNQKSDTNNDRIVDIFDAVFVASRLI